MHGRRSMVRWDELPEPLIQNIQSCLLDPRDIVRTSVLSKAWHNAWFTIPFLRFHESALGCPKNVTASILQSCKFRKLVDYTVARYAQNNMLIETFDISIDNVDEKVISLCMDWIQVALAAGNGLKWISVFGQPSSYKLLPLSFPLNPTIECRSLLVLRLYYVHIDEEVIRKLFSICLSIEDVCLYYCVGFNKVQVRDLHRLRIFHISLAVGNKIVQIDNAPSLCKFSCCIRPWDDTTRGGLKISALENLRSLELQNMRITDKDFNQLIAKFPVLQCLIIQEIHLLKKINITCELLNELKISWCNKLMHVEVHSAALRKLLLRHYGYSNRLPMATFSLPNLTHKQLDTSLQVSGRVANSCTLLWMREVVELTHKLEVSFSNCTESEIDPDYWRNITLPPESIEELVIYVFPTPRTYFSSIIDALFSICHPKYVSKKWGTPDEFSMFLMRELMERAKSRCCISTDQKCWRHYLKDVEIGLSRKGNLTSNFNMRVVEPLEFPWRCMLDGSKRFPGNLIFKLIW